MDPVRAQVSRTTAGTRSDNPFSSIIGRWMGRRDAVWDAQLGLATHEARNNLNRQHQKNLSSDGLEEAQKAKGIGLRKYGRTSHGGVDFDFGEGAGTPKPVAAGAQKGKGGKGKGTNPAQDVADLDLTDSPADAKQEPVNALDTNKPARKPRQYKNGRTPTFKELDEAVARGGITTAEAAELNKRWSTARGGTGADFDQDAVAPIWSEGRTQTSNITPPNKANENNKNLPKQED